MFSLVLQCKHIQTLTNETKRTEIKNEFNGSLISVQFYYETFIRNVRAPVVEWLKESSVKISFFKIKN